MVYLAMHSAHINTRYMLKYILRRSIHNPPKKVLCSTIHDDFFLDLECILVHKLLINYKLCLKNTHPDFACIFVHIHLHSVQGNFYNAYCFKAAIENACLNVPVNILVNMYGL